MKKFSKLIPAFCMLLISAMLMGTSTFAWFSMNTTVTATGMNVKAVVNDTFLQISTSSDGTYSTTVSGAFDSTKELKPVAPMETLTAANVETKTNWGTAVSNDFDDANVNANKTALDADATLSDYVISKSFYIKTASGTTDATNLRLVGMKVANSNANDTLKCLRVVLVCGDKIQVIEADATTLDGTILSDLVTSTATEVKVYFYYAGNDEDCKSSNAANIGTITVDLEFSVNNAAHNDAKLNGATATYNN